MGKGKTRARSSLPCWVYTCCRLALRKDLLKDLLARQRSAKELEFADDTVDLVWLDNSNSDEAFVFTESYRDNKNSPYFIIDRVDTAISTYGAGVKMYSLPQDEVDRIERLLNGKGDSDSDSEEESCSDSDDDDEGHPRRMTYSTRAGRSAKQLMPN